MQYFYQESALYACVSELVCEEEAMKTMSEIVNVTKSIADDLSKLKSGKKNFENVIDLLCFSHKWEMKKTYTKILKHVKKSIMDSEFEEYMVENICDDIWIDILNDCKKNGKILKKKNKKFITNLLKLANGNKIWMLKKAISLGFKLNSFFVLL